jgi:hypothetical protein
MAVVEVFKAQNLAACLLHRLAKDPGSGTLSYVGLRSPLPPTIPACMSTLLGAAGPLPYQL